jgi:hypothetical protein
MRQSSASALAKDRRALERVVTALRGKVFPSGDDCVIANFTKHGALLRFVHRPSVTDQVILVVWSSGVAFEAQVRWRSRHDIGVQFHSSRDLRRPAPAHLAEIQALWARRRPRIGRRALIKSAAIIDKRSRWPRGAGWGPSGPAA